MSMRLIFSSHIILKTNKFDITLEFRVCRKCQVNHILTNRKFKLGFCSLNEGGTKIKVPKVLKDNGNIKIIGFSFRNGIKFLMQRFYVR